MDASIVAIRLIENSGNTPSLETDWDAATRANRGGPSLDLADTAIDGTPTDVTARCDYWEYTHGNNVDIDNLYGFNTGLYMSEPRRGQRSHAFEIGIPYEDDSFFDAATATTSYSVEMIVAQDVSTTSGTSALQGIHMVIPFAFLSAAPTLYAKGPTEFQRLNFVPKISGDNPSILFDVFTQTLTDLAA